MRERMRNLDQVANETTEQFNSRLPIHSVWVLYQRDVDFRAYVFLDRTVDLVALRSSGTYHEIVDFVYQALERWDRGKRGNIVVAFEFDSDERVQDEYEGDYNLRMHAGGEFGLVHFFDSAT